MLWFRSFVPLLPLALIPMGCGSGIAHVAPVTTTTTTVVAPANPVTPVVPVAKQSALMYYHSLGDSITAGYRVDATTQAYPVLLGKSLGLPLSNYGDSGDGACDIAWLQAFQHADNPTLASRGLYTMIISTNDVDNKGAGAYEAVFNTCQQAMIAWVALPIEFKVMSTSSLVTTQGPTHLDPQHNYNALTTDSAHSTLSFPVHLTNAGPVYVWYRITDGNSGTFDYVIDGASAGSLLRGTTPAVNTRRGVADTVAFLRIPSIKAGDHVISFRQTSQDPDGAGILAVGVPPSTPQAGMPLVAVGTTPRQIIDGTTSAGCTMSDAPCVAYIADIRENVALLASDGLGVRIFDTRKYMTATLNGDMADDIHPNAIGHTEIYRAIEEALP